MRIRRPRRVKTKWTNEQNEILRTLWMQGVSIENIRKHMKTHGSMTVGPVGINNQVRLLGLPHRDNGPELLRAPTSERLAKSIERDQPATLTPPSTSVCESEEGVTMIELTNTSCRYPYGGYEEKAVRFCGKEALPGSSFCTQHREIAVRRKEGIEKTSARA